VREESRSTRERLLQSGAELMADRGFKGVSVRAICKHADTSMNMIHHFFGSKQGLLDAIVAMYGNQALEVPMWLLQTPPKSQQEFESRMELLFAATLDACVEHRSLLMVVIREQADPPALSNYMARLSCFLEEAKTCGYVRANLDTEMITGAMLDRIMAQVQFAPWLKRTLGIDVSADRAYRTRWSRANVDLFLHGMVPAELGAGHEGEHSDVG